MFMGRKNITGVTESIMIGWAGRVERRGRKAKGQVVSLDNDQLDTHFLYFTIRRLQSPTCFEHYMLIIRRLNCIDAASGIGL